MTETSRVGPHLSRGGGDALDDGGDAFAGVVGAPLLHDLVSCVSAPTLVLSGPDGQIRPDGVQGWFHHDRRLLSALMLAVNGREPDGLRGESRGADSAAFTGVIRHAGDAGTDPTVLVDRVRVLSGQALRESFTVTSAARAAVDVEVALCVHSDLAPMATVRSGQPTTPVRPAPIEHGLAWHEPGESPGAERVRLTCDPPPDRVDAATGMLLWRTSLRTGEQVTVSVIAEATETADATPGAFAGSAEPHRRPWSTPRVVAADVRMRALVRQSLDDLSGLLLRDTVTEGTADGDQFLAAGTPWFLTLFGRDSLWAARMLLPLGTDLAMSTLRTLARRQGERDDAETEEQPGKILHEVRREPLVLATMTLPPVYYGTIDATPLFVVLLADAWRWGAPPGEVEALLPAAERCLGWVQRELGEGFLAYVDRTGRGLTNQGWKDSDDGVQWADGRLAEPPIALSEVQGYAYESLVRGADLLDAFDRPGAERWRAAAAALRQRFREAFWVTDAAGDYPAVALDRNGGAVDSVASNMGHLLGTGILDPRESALVAARLAGPDMDSGFGLRTLTARSPRFSRLSYHGGTVWPHDTAIAAHGLMREGHPETAAALLRGLLEAAPAFGYRLPELYGGDSADAASAPTPYPSACRPQAWSATAVLHALTTLLGIEPDVPTGRVRVRGGATPFGPMSVSGLRLGPRALRVSVDAGGVVSAGCDDPSVEVLCGEGSTG
ncbi:MAG TPA: glycogen debranching N-terminal domain-containing protein [Nocardioidaceae bacterium]|nr:glycogen debranching N-terminal domain-containing protein [Nocardioidaceae bacterium]